MAEEVVRALRATHAVEAIEIAGSARRRRETVGDLAVLATSRKPARVLDAFVAMPAVTRVLAHGDTKASVACRVEGHAPGVQIDLRVVEPKAYGTALQYFAGSKDHNVRLREIAQRQGLKLSEYGIFDRGGRRLGGAREEEVFRAVGLPFIPPELREDTGEIEAAQAGTLPALIEHDSGKPVSPKPSAYPCRTSGRSRITRLADGSPAAIDGRN